MEKKEDIQENSEELKKNKRSENPDLEIKEEEKEETIEDKIKSLEDKLARTLAEMENQRRRYEKEKEDAFEYGGFSFAREALNILDNLERAKQSLENDNELKNSKVLKKAMEHFKILNDHLISVFKKNNIQQIKSINEKLDPNLHQAMLEIEDDSREAGTIVQEIQKGFTMKDRLLRPSLVGVSKKKQSNDEKDEENQQKSEKN